MTQLGEQQSTSEAPALKRGPPMGSDGGSHLNQPWRSPSLSALEPLFSSENRASAFVDEQKFQQRMQ